MTINHHPDEETLAAFTAGNLDEPRSVVVAAHVALCPRCRATVAGFEQFGGTLVEREVPAPLDRVPLYVRQGSDLERLPIPSP